jgi:hypothetical protein
MKLETVLAATCILAAFASSLGAACTNNPNIHDTDQASGQPCINCHQSAYALVKNPKHEGLFPQTCETCHSTNAWIPASGGHPESKFPITTGSHSNKAIACADCHIASLGSDVAGQNTDCVHCHLGAHTLPSIDGAHTTVAGYSPASASMPHSCLSAGCHPSG